jgi:hypothetical protein
VGRPTAGGRRKEEEEEGGRGKGDNGTHLRMWLNHGFENVAYSDGPSHAALY